ncbi:hypothetical protein F1714_11465, partial [Streptococcus pneumoniae]
FLMAAVLLGAPALATVKRFELVAQGSVFPVDEGVYVEGLFLQRYEPGPMLWWRKGHGGDCADCFDRGQGWGGRSAQASHFRTFVTRTSVLGGRC